jgi:Na+/H+ antiporter NhaD/arsenite permease-like protein
MPTTATAIQTMMSGVVDMKNSTTVVALNASDLPRITALGIVALIMFIIAVLLIVWPLKFKFWVTVPQFVDCLFGEPLRQPRKRTVMHITFKLGLVTAPAIVMLLLLACTALTWQNIVDGIVGTGLLEPWAVTIIFFSMSYMSVSLDETGMLAAMSFWGAQKSGKSGRRLFFAVFVLSGLFTLFTSNDIVVMTLTPVVIYATTYIKTDPTPFLFIEFFAANVWSSALYFSNATNIILAEAEGYTFNDVAKWCVLPTVVAAIALYAFMAVAFRDVIPGAIDTPEFDAMSLLHHRVSAIIGSLILFSTIVMLIIFSFVSVPVWIATLAAAATMFVKDLIVDIIALCRGESQYYVGANVTRFRDDTGGVDDFFDAASDDEHKPKRKRAVSESTVGANEARRERDGMPLPRQRVQSAASIEVQWRQNVTGAADSDEEEEEIATSDFETAIDDPTVPDVVTWSAFTPRWARTLARRFPTVSAVLMRQPWSLLPFILSKFVLVECLSSHGWTHLLAYGAAQAIINVPSAAYLAATVTILLTNLMSGIPMSILLARVLTSPFFAVSPAVKLATAYSVMLLSNYAGNTTLVGSLAGLLWLSILKRKGVHSIGFLSFAKTGGLASLIVGVLAVGMLIIEVLYFGYSLEPSIKE